MLNCNVKEASPGKNGFDVNQILTPTIAKLFASNGFDFCIRYLPRGLGMGADPITASEIQVILNAGLALSLVQHVLPEGWRPTKELGAAYGAYAAKYAQEIGLPDNMVLWLDLEGVNPISDAEDVIQYCTYWHINVVKFGYGSGLYIGWQPGLNNQQLHDSLPFIRYWRAYNADNDPLPRGYQMIQHPQKTLNGVAYDPNTTQLDLKGDSFLWLAP